MFKFATLCTLVLALTASTHAQADNNQRIVVVRNFHGENCENQEQSTVSFKFVSEECEKIAPLAWMKSSCADQFTFNLCVDENCQNCVERQVASDECIPDEAMTLQCDSESNISQYVNMNNVNYRIIVYRSESENAECDNSKRIWEMFLENDKCHQIMERFFLKAVQGDNENQAKLQFFKNAECTEQIDSINELPLTVDECVSPDFLPLENIAMKIERVQQQQ